MSSKFSMGGSISMGGAGPEAGFGAQPAQGAGATGLSGFGGDPTPAPAAAVKDVSTQSFMADVVDASRERPVIVDFWAPWCGPCKTLGPVIERVVAEQKGKVTLAKMDIEQHPEIAGQMGIQSIPAVVAFVNGQPADAFMGAQPEAQVRAFVERLAKQVSTPEEDATQQVLDAAAAMEAAGDHAGAAQAYGQLAQMDPTNLHALAGLGRVYVAAGQLAHARQLLDTVPPEEQAREPMAAFRLALEQAEQAESLGDVGELKARVDANPDDHQARFDYAVALNGRGRREEAAEELLHIVRRDREWNDDGARKQLVEFFEAWGFKDPASQLGRRGLSSILFS